MRRGEPESWEARLSAQKRWLSHRTPKEERTASEGGPYKAQRRPPQTAAATEIEYLWDRWNEVAARMAERAIDREGRGL
jgi:hypothetical protein